MRRDKMNYRKFGVFRVFCSTGAGQTMRKASFLCILVHLFDVFIIIIILFLKHALL